MFERFRIKTALRKHVVRLRDTQDAMGLRNAEQLFGETSIIVADDMRRNRWTAHEAMVFMVTDVPVQVDAVGNLAAFATEDPASYAALRALYDQVAAVASIDPALAPRVSRPSDGRASPFDTSPGQ